MVNLLRTVYNPTVADQERFFRELGTKVRALRKKKGFSQEDMISFGFSARHWQQIETGRPITVTTLLRICEVFEVSMSTLVKGIDNGIYDPPTSILIPRKKRRTKR